ncbi:hypothetical protein V5298_05100 [Alteromonas sp. 14N.309.X.WAT.G.H12]
MFKPLFKVCAIGAIAGFSSFLPIPTIVKAAIVIFAFIALFFLKIEKDDE